MNVYLIRHAEAVPLGTDGIATDEVRPLTEWGVEQSRGLAGVFHRIGVQFDAIVTSHLLRAKQTTEYMLERVPTPHPTVHVFDEIGLEVRPRRVIRFLQKLGAKSAAVVGHQPGLARFAGWLIGDKKVNLDLKKAGFAWIECKEWDKGGGTLRWLAAPELVMLGK